MRYDVSIAINAPAERVWSVVSDVERWPRVTASVSSVERLEHGPFAVGSRARIKQPRLATMIWTVTALEPGRSFTWTASSPGMNVIGEHRVEPGPGDAVTVTLSIVQSGLLEPIVRLLYGGLTRRYIQMEAEGVKRVSTGDPQLASAAPEPGTR